MLEDVFHDHNGNALGLLDGRLLVQARTGVLTLHCVDAVADFLRNRALPTPFGLIAVVNGDTGIMPEDIRARQLAHLTWLLGTGAHIVTVVYGDTVHASVMRSAGRMMLLGQPRLQHLQDVPTAAAFLAERLSMSAAAIQAAVIRLQRDAIEASAS